MDFSLPNRQGYAKLTAGQERAVLLSAAGCGAHWRVVDLWTDSSRPFEVEIQWSAGGAGGQTARVSVSRAARVALFTRDLFVWATNLAQDTNEVRVSVADSDGSVRTENSYEVDFDATQGGGEVEVSIPPYSALCRVELADASYATTAMIRVYDGSDQLRSELVVADQPSAGLRLGAAKTLTVEDGAVGRVVFALQL